ncbi:hypothetical protein SAMN05192551_101129 [Tindallia magadiensis]|uniref:Type II secretory pathway, pseudopilin PulG n=1 Tax=Tindallia magadiensis TaxID=69895 RepID=A0A1I3ACR6_9FIRM|nr:hypothetical protein [Tindallia magadiensis]SFH47745.1 hypothetical protein SAMN05192551_101129 [Tindallia magadiensis]
MKRIAYRLKNNKGIALVYVLMAFLVLMIFMSSVVFIFSTNHKQAIRQDDHMRAYYLALSGIDVTKSTLLMPLYVEDEEEKNMMDKMKSDGPIYIDDSLEIDGEDIEISVEFDEDRNTFVLTSEVVTDKGITSKLILELEMSGNRYQERWIKQ